MEFDTIKVKGHVKFQLYNQFGELKDVTEVSNLVVTGGKNFIAGRLVGDPAVIPYHIGLGSGTATPADGDTGITQLGSRVAVTPTASNNVVSFSNVTFGAGAATGAVTEAGIFTASTAGTMICRTTFAVINKGANDSLVVSWTITIN